MVGQKEYKKNINLTFQTSREAEAIFKCVSFLVFRREKRRVITETADLYQLMGEENGGRRQSELIVFYKFMLNKSFFVERAVLLWFCCWLIQF